MVEKSRTAILQVKWALLEAFLNDPDQNPEEVYRNIRQSEEFMPRWLKTSTLRLKSQLIFPESSVVVAAAEEIIKEHYQRPKLN